VACNLAWITYGQSSSGEDASGGRRSSGWSLRSGIYNPRGASGSLLHTFAESDVGEQPVSVLG